MPKLIDRDEKRREILDAALQAFSRNGYRDTNLQRVAVAAGIGKSSIYHYFPTRDALFQALMQHLLESEIALFDEVLTAGGTASERLEALVSGVEQVIDAWVKTGPLLIDCLHDKRGRKAVARTLRRIHEPLRRLIADGQRAGEFRRGDPAALATVVIACLDGVLLLRLLDPEIVSRPKVAAELRAVIRAGLGAGRENG